MEFAEVRPYQAGDDIRTIDWRVTARTQDTYTKLYQEEKERPVYLVVDQRSPMFFGSRKQFKSYLSATLASLIAWSTLKKNDSLGAIVFADNSQSDLRPKRGKRATLRCLNTLADFNYALASRAIPNLEAKSVEPIRNHPDISNQVQSLSSIMKELRRISRPGSAIYVISDFHDFDTDCERELSTLARHNDIELLHIYDPLEKALPEKATLTITNGMKQYVVDTNNKSVLDQYSRNWESFRKQLSNAALKSRIRFHSLSTNTSARDHAIALFGSKKTVGGN